jgi:hypothetical protein
MPSNFSIRKLKIQLKKNAPYQSGGSDFGKENVAGVFCGGGNRVENTMH